MYQDHRGSLEFERALKMLYVSSAVKSTGREVDLEAEESALLASNFAEGDKESLEYICIQ